MMDFEGQIVIVTGGTRGIGAGITESFLERGANVVSTYARNDQAANEFKEKMVKFSERLFLEKFDVSDSKEVDEFYKRVIEKHGKIDVLVNNSGIRQDNMMAMMSDEEWDSVIKTNLRGSYLMSKKIIKPFLKNRYGRIVNISSIGGILGLPGQTNYAASKAGQMAMAKSLSKELGKRGITVNNVCPGFIETDMTASMPQDQVEEYKKQIPARRFGTVYDVAHAVMFLASKEASYINGANLEVTGGL